MFLQGVFKPWNSLLHISSTDRQIKSIEGFKNYLKIMEELDVEMQVQTLLSGNI